MPEPQDEPSKQALITALRLLAASPKSRQELKTKLESKGYHDEAVRFALNELTHQGVLDDHAYAKNLTSQLIHGKSSGRHKIAFELKRHGIRDSVKKEILDTLSETSESERAMELALRKWPGFANLDPRHRKKKLFDHLIRKGYDFQIVHDVIEKIAKESQDELNPNL